MITLNPQYEAIFSPRNLDEDCDRMAGGINVVCETIKEILKVGMYKQAVTMYLQLLLSMPKHFIEDEHWCYYDDWYSPDFALRQIYETILQGCD